MGDQWLNDIKPMKTDWKKPYLEKAPYLIVVFKQSYGILADGRRKIHYYNELSCSIAVGILLAAIQVGLILLCSKSCGYSKSSAVTSQALLVKKAIGLLVLNLSTLYLSGEAFVGNHTVSWRKRHPLFEDKGYKRAY